MFNPIYPFTKAVFEVTVKGGGHYLRSTYIRLFDHSDENIQGYFLINHNNDVATGLTLTAVLIMLKVKVLRAQPASIVISKAFTYLSYQ